MRFVSFLIGVFILCAFSACQQARKHTLTFEVAVPDGPPSRVVGIRGSAAPLDWQRSIPLIKVAKSNMYQITIDIPENVQTLEYKFVIGEGDALQWEGINNRELFLSSATSKISSVWDMADPVDLSRLPVLTADQKLEDAKFLIDALTEIHPGIYRYNDQSSLNSIFDAFTKSYTQATSYSDMYLAVSQLLAELKCDHTAAIYNQEAHIDTLLHHGDRFLPLSFQWIGAEMIVTGDATDDQLLPVGTKIFAIDNVHVDEIFERLSLYVSVDGPSKVARRAKLNLNASSLAYDEFDVFHTQSFPALEGFRTLHIQRPEDAKSVEVVVPLMSRSNRSRRLNERDAGRPKSFNDLWSFKVLDDQTAYMKLGNFGVQDYFGDWKTFIDDAFAEVAANDLNYLVLDLRHNTGGQDEVGFHLLPYLADTPCQDNSFAARTRFLNFPERLKGSMRTWNTWFYDLADEQHFRSGDYFEFPGQTENPETRPRSEAILDEVYVLTSGKNTSAAFYFANTLRNCGYATFIGEETGGSLRGLNGGAIIFLKLPNSEIVANIPVMGMFARSTKPMTGVVPDYEVDQSIQSITEQSDPVLDATLNLIRDELR
jgi:hypothetical protein